LVEGKGVVVAVAAGVVERGHRRKDGWGAMWRVAQTSGETADDDDGGRET